MLLYIKISLLQQKAACSPFFVINKHVCGCRYNTWRIRMSHTSLVHAWTMGMWKMWQFLHGRQTSKQMGMSNRKVNCIKCEMLKREINHQILLLLIVSRKSFLSLKYVILFENNKCLCVRWPHIPVWPEQSRISTTCPGF